MDAPERNLRRQFRLPEEDERFLNSLNRDWETLAENGQRWIIVRRMDVPTGYNVNGAEVAIMAAPGYPPGPLDMAYFYPPLVRATGVVPRNTEGRVTIDGKAWQAWSRHRPPENPWVMGEDNLESHFFYVLAWLTDDLKR